MTRWWREVRRTLAMFPTLLLGGCGAFLVGPAWCLSEAQHDPVIPDTIALTITSPAQGVAFEDEAITIAFEVDANVGGVTVTATAGGADAVIDLPDGVLTGALTLTPAADSGHLGIALDAWFDGDPTVLTSQTLGVEWTAPWEATILDCGAPPCTPLAADASLSGIEDLSAGTTWDGARLAGVEVTIDGAAPDDLDPRGDRVRFDVDQRVDGAVTLAVTAVRDDGARATVTRPIAVANCVRARANAQYHVAAYTADGLEVTGADTVTRFDLHDGTSAAAPPLDGQVTALALDEPGDLAYLGVRTPATTYRLSAIDYASPGPEQVVDAAAQVLSVTVGPDGALYWTEGARGGTPAGAVWRSAVGQPTTRVDVGGLAGADGVLFDDDGSLLVAAGATVQRLTLAAGVETARATVLTRDGATLTQLALDDLHRLYVTDKAVGELLRYADGATVPEVLYTQLDWTMGGAHEPWSLSFVEYPPLCHGLLITRQGLDDARRLVDVGAVRGRP